ncbi:MAG TPA: DUF4230 domain-containing protein [Sandaracinaceae bacterium]
MNADGSEARAAEPDPGRAPAPSEHADRLRRASIGLVVVAVACLGGAASSWVASLVRGAPEPAETVVVRPTADVVVAVRDLARLETASYHVERVIDVTSRQSRLGGLLEAQDSILLVAAADVVAGVDLASLGDDDVEVDAARSRIAITLPPVQILSARLDNDRTYVHRRETDLLARRRESLETEARREAEQTMRQAAIESGILERAEQNARRTIESLVRSLGYRHVEVRFRDEERP